MENMPDTKLSLLELFRRGYLYLAVGGVSL